MTPKKIYIHIGAHKTASTTLQRTLGRNKDALEKNGIFYFKRRNDTVVGDFGHLAWYRDFLKNQSKFESATGTCKEFVDQLDFDHIVISNEDFLGMPDAKLKCFYPFSRFHSQCFRKATEGHDVSIIFYIRNQIDFLQSYYIQRVKTGLSMNFDSYVSRFDLDQISWMNVIEPWIEEFGSVYVADFESIKQGTDEWMQRFSDRACKGMKLRSPKTQHANPGLCQEGIQLAVSGNRVLTKSQMPAFRRFLENNLRLDSGSPPILIDPEIRSKITERYKKENMIILDKFRL